MFDIEFWKSFLSNAFATFFGAIIGIPIALWINRRQQKASEKSEKEQATIETKKQEEEILRLIEAELLFNKKLIQAAINPTKDMAILYSLKDESWKVLSNGGEVHWIQDLVLRDSVAYAYYGLRLLLEKANRNREIFNDDYIPDDDQLLQFHISIFVEMNFAKDAVENALEAIKNNLKKS